MAAKLVIALCLFVNGELLEHRIQNSMSDCLKHKREAQRHINQEDQQLMCGEVKANVAKNIDGSLYIENIIHSK
jgi:hypothetical protein